MATFQPPTVDEVPSVLPKDIQPWPFGKTYMRLFGHYKQRARGKTLLLLTDGTVVDAGTFPTQTVADDPSTGDVWTETGLNGLTYKEFGGTISRVFTGGHVHVINATEATQLTNAGYASGIS